MSGTGTLTMSGSNTYSGGTTISAGTLRLGADNVLADSGAVSVTGGVFDIGSYHDTVGGVTLSSGSIVGGSGALTAASYSVTNGTGTTTLISANLGGNTGLSMAGAGLLTLSGVNTYTGATTITNGTINFAGNYALASPNITSSNGSMSVQSGYRLQTYLVVTGAITLVGDVATTGSQTYQSAVIINAGDATNPVNVSTSNSAIVFNDTLTAKDNNKTKQISLNLDAGTSAVTFNGLVQDTAFLNNYYRALLTNGNLYNLSVTAQTININADITTMGSQSYHGNVVIGDSGQASSGQYVVSRTTRVLLSVDPTIEFFGTIEDSAADTHSLIVRAIALDMSMTPQVTINGSVGTVNPLSSIELSTGVQVISVSSLRGDIDTNPYQLIGKVTINGEVTTVGNQTYQANNIVIGETLPGAKISFTTKNGTLTFTVGQNLALNPGLTAGTGVQINLNYGTNGKLSAESQAALKSSGVKFSTPIVGGFSDAASLNYEVNRNNVLPRETFIEPDVSVGEPLEVDCVADPKDGSCLPKTDKI